MSRSKKFQRVRRGLLWLFGLALVLVLFFFGIVEWGSRQLTSPPRKEIQDYHREILSDPAARGIRITGFQSSDGTPVLVCEPNGRVGTRGALLRKQLVSRGLSLPPAGTVVGTLVLVHGRKGRKEDYLPIAERLCAVGFRCLLPDLPAHGDHPTAVVSGGLAERAMPARVLDEAARTVGFDPKPAGLFGISMGGSVAVHAAGEEGASWRALVAISSYDSYHTVVDQQINARAGQRFGRLYLKAVASGFKARTGFPLRAVQPARIAPEIRIPSLIAHGTEDDVVPFAAGQRLFAAFTNCDTKRWVTVPNADHDNVLITDFPIYAEVASWMLTHVPNPGLVLETGARSGGSLDDR